MASRAKLIDRLTKLVALEASPNANEAKAAHEQAEKLMSKHGLTRADVRAKDFGYHERVLPGRGWDALWKRKLAAAAARYYGAEAVFRRVGRGTEVRIVGEHADVLQADKLVRRLLRLVRDLEKKAVEVLERNDDVVSCLDYELPKRKRTDSFRAGIAQGLVCVLFRFSPARQSEPGVESRAPTVSSTSPASARSTAVARVMAGTGQNHSARVASRYHPEVRSASEDDVDSVWFTFGQYMAERYVRFGPDGKLEVREQR